MAAVAKLAIRCVFSDDTTSTITINNINPDNINVPTIKQTIWQFNDDPSGYRDLMQSKNGGGWIGIDSAKITETDRQYLF